MQEQLWLIPESDRWYLPQVTVADYNPPVHFPDISQAPRIILDLETQGLDPLRGGYIVGISIGIKGWKQYYPIRHKSGPNCDSTQVLRWLKDQLKFYTGEIVGANSNLFDGFFLQKAGIYAAHAKWRDVQWAEALLDEYADNYKLNTLGLKYTGQSKLSDDIKNIYGPKVMAHFSEVHPGHASPYALQDLDLAGGVYEKQIPLLQADNLFDLFDLECRLSPLLNYMRELGVDVDIDQAEQLQKELKGDYETACVKMQNIVGFPVDPFSSKSLRRAFDGLSIKYPLTEKGNPSFTNLWLKQLKHPFSDLLNEAREYEKIRGTFVQSYILEGNINGTIHAELHPLRRADEEGVRGTVSGRFSMSNPNLQNIPVRTELGRRIRNMFVPNIFMNWYSADYSQMEYRLLAHYSVLSGCDGSEAVQKMYRENPDIDFHQMVADIAGIDRKPAKTLNFGLCYGMGVKKLAASLGLVDSNGDPLPKALEIMDTFHSRAPFIKEIYNKASERAEKKGYVTTLLDRRCRFNLFEPKHIDKGSFFPALPYEQALEKYGKKIKRTGTHKALNRILQGSNADVTKKAMVDIWESGLLKTGNITLALTVHDELDGSVDPGAAGDKALGQLKEFMASAVNLEVPVQVSTGVGQNWGEAH